MAIVSRIVYVGKHDGLLADHDEIAHLIHAAGLHLGIPVNNLATITDDNLDGALFVPIGGDGTTLTAIREASKWRDCSVFGLNFGHLGFLTSPGTKDQIYDLLISVCDVSRTWVRDQRMLIKTILPANNVQPAVNEFLITTPDRRALLEYSIFINDNHVGKFRGDGVIVTTATGSTAYSMSAGGAIMAPTSRAMQITPLAAHTISARPIIVSEHDEVKIRGFWNERSGGVVSLVVDGYDTIHRYPDAVPGAYIDTTITRHKFVTILRPENWNFFEVLTEKMGWAI